MFLQYLRTNIFTDQSTGIKLEEKRNYPSSSSISS